MMSSSPKPRRSPGSAASIAWSMSTSVATSIPRWKLMGTNSTIAVYATNGNRTPVVPMRDLMEKCITVRALVLFALPPPLLAAAQGDITSGSLRRSHSQTSPEQFGCPTPRRRTSRWKRATSSAPFIVDCAH